MTMARQTHPLGLYLHIPFCRSKCAYCDFYSLSGREDRMDAYTAALERHLIEVAPQAAQHLVDTVYFGGGTPSYLGEKRLVKLLKAVKKHYRIAPHAEITLEANPDSAGDWKALRALRRAGFNRLSLGMQSGCPQELESVHRPHTVRQVDEAVAAARKAKLNNNDVLVLEYQQKDTKAKPSPPKNLRVESVTSNSVTLTWDPVTGAGAYKIYQVEKSSGDLFEMKTLAGTATSWTHEKLNSNSSYIYVAETVTQSGETSITSKEVKASTLEANGNFIITKQPELTETTYAGGEVNLSVEAEYLNADNTRNELHYQWQVYDRSTKQWKSLRNGNGATYTATVTE